MQSLGQNGCTPVPLVRKAAGLPGEIVTGDLSDGALTGADLAGCEAVIHLAARTHVMNETANDPLAEYRRVNVEGTARLLDACIAAKVRRFVFVSSIKAIGERSLPGEPLRPDTPPRPEDAYGISKLEAEQWVQQRCDTAGIEWVILRPPLVYGRGNAGNLQLLARAVGKGIPLPLGAVRNRRSLVSVRNLAAAAVAAARSPDAAGKMLHIADLTLSTPELVRELAAAAQVKARLVPVPTSPMLALAGLIGRAEQIRRLLESLELDSAASWQALGIAPPFDPRAELRTAITQ